MGCLSNLLCNVLKYIIKNLAIFSDVPTNVPSALNALSVPFPSLRVWDTGTRN